MKKCKNYKCKNYNSNERNHCKQYNYLESCGLIKQFPAMAEEEPINWLKTGWAKSKQTNTKYMIIVYNEGKYKPYYLSGPGWCTEEHLIENYEPCESPIGR
jgi:hypothetical protein